MQFNPIELTHIHSSEIGNFSCPLKWWFNRGFMGYGVVPKLESVNLWFGSLMHKWLEKYHTEVPYVDITDPAVPIKWWDQSWEEQKVEDMKLRREVDWGDDDPDYYYHLGYNMVKYYAQKTQDNFVPLVIEADFRIGITDSNCNTIGEYWGTFDALVRDKVGVWIMDHKTSKNTWTLEKMLTDNQLTLYLYAAKVLGVPDLKGYIFNIMYKDYPKDPPELKNGGLSRNKMFKCSYESYIQALDTRGLDPADYIDHLAYLKCQPDPFLQREYIRRGDSEIDMMATILTNQFIAMKRMAENPHLIYPVKSYGNCGWCDYKLLCDTYHAQEDLRGVAVGEYRLNDRYHEDMKKRSKPSKMGTYIFEKISKNKMK